MDKVDFKRFEKFEPIGCPTEADIERGISQLCRSVEEARKEAWRHNIKANAVMINDELYYSRLCSTEGGIYLDIPMICGLRVLLSKDELPEDTLFSVSYAPHLQPSEREELDRLRQENEELRAFKERILAAMEVSDDE